MELGPETNNATKHTGNSGQKCIVFHLITLVPVMWTCVRCPVDQLDQRRKCWQGLRGAISYWPSSLAPFLAKRQKVGRHVSSKAWKMEKKRTPTPHIGSCGVFCFPASEPQSNYTKLEKLHWALGPTENKCYLNKKKKKWHMVEVTYGGFMSLCARLFEALLIEAIHFKTSAGSLFKCISCTKSCVWTSALR